MNNKALKKADKTIKFLDYVLIKPWPECQFGLARVYRHNYKGKTYKVAQGHCFDENGKPMSFSLDMTRFKHIWRKP